MKLDYGQLITRAFEITKNNRALWVFGFILALFGGLGFNFTFPNFSFDNSSFRRTDFDDIPFRKISSIDPTTIILIIVAVAVLLLVIWLIAKLLQALANGALVDMVDKVDKGDSITVKSGFKEGFSLSLPLVGVSFTIWIPAIIGIILLGGLTIGPGLFLLLAEYQVAGIILMILGGLLWIALIFIIAVASGVIGLYANRYLVLEDQGVIESIKSGFGLLRANLGQSTLLWLINMAFGVGQAIVGFAVLLVVVLVLSLVLGLPIALLALAVSKWLFILLAIPILLFIVAISFYAGLFQSFYSSYWTLAFKKMTETAEVSS